MTEINTQRSPGNDQRTKPEKEKIPVFITEPPEKQRTEIYRRIKEKNMEKNFSGYCRVSDGSRLVFLEQDDDGTWEAECNYDADCPYR